MYVSETHQKPTPTSYSTSDESSTPHGQFCTLMDALHTFACRDSSALGCIEVFSEGERYCNKGQSSFSPSFHFISCLMSFTYLSHLLLIKICLLIASCFASCSTHDPHTPLGILFLQLYKACIIYLNKPEYHLSPYCLRSKSLTQGSKPFAIV
jgi:hypothetical protein